MRSDICIPIVFMCAVVIATAVLTYSNAQGPFVTAVFPIRSDSPFVLASRHNSSIVASDEYSVTLYSPTSEIRTALLEEGAIFVDTQGVQTCLQP